jgi:hypothetical protein
VDHDIHQIDQHPAALLHPLDVPRLVARHSQGLDESGDEGLHVGVRRSAADNETVGCIADHPQVQNQDVLRLLLLQNSGDERQPWIL